MNADAVVAAAQEAKAAGSARFCMGAAWREPKERDMPALTDMVRRVNDLGLETCMTLGIRPLPRRQRQRQQRTVQSRCTHV